VRCGRPRPPLERINRTVKESQIARNVPIRSSQGQATVIAFAGAIRAHRSGARAPDYSFQREGGLFLTRRQVSW
jgi:hypothetical protein